jgi:hypothetical protein
LAECCALLALLLLRQSQACGVGLCLACCEAAFGGLQAEAWLVLLLLLTVVVQLLLPLLARLLLVLPEAGCTVKSSCCCACALVTMKTVR